MSGLICNKASFRLLVPILALLINGARSHALQEIPQAFAGVLQERSSFLGGWAVYTPGACPDQTASCPFKQFCCPTNTVCSIDSLGGAAVCCPDKNDCASYAEAVPSCADTNWGMYEYSGKTSFCCQPGQVGLAGGVCADKGIAVPSTQLASSVVQITGTVAGSAASTAPGSGYSAAITGTAAQGTHTPATTQNNPASAGTDVYGSSPSPPSSSSLSGGILGGIVAGAVVGLIIIALLVYLAFICGRRRGARENYPQNQYQPREIYPSNQMAPPTPNMQSAHPQKYDGYGVQATPFPMGQNNFSPPAPVRVSEVGDNRPHTYDRAELGPAT